MAMVAVIDANDCKDHSRSIHVNKDIDEGDNKSSVALNTSLRKVSRVLLPFLFLAATATYVDKSNVSFAAIALNPQLGLSPVDYGIGSGLYYTGFGVAMLPSVFISMKYGARFWLGGITVAGGIISTCHALMMNKTGFYLLRFLLGVVEAGIPSSTGHLLASFYPQNRMAVPAAVVVVASTVSGIFAAPLAAGLMAMDGIAGLEGWQWLFILEGLPVVVVGAAIMVWLPSSPLTAWMLAPEERELLHREVHGSQEDADAARVPPHWRELLTLTWDTVRRPLLWFFTAVLFLWVLAYTGVVAWLPILVNNMISGTALSQSTSSSQSTKAILLSGIPLLCGSISMLLVAWHADRVNEQNLHIAVPYILGGVVLTLFTPLSQISFGAGFAVLVLSVTMANAGLGTQSARLIGCLDKKSAGIGVAIYTAASACLAGFAGPVVVGALVQHTGSFSRAYFAMGPIMAAAGLLVLGLAVWEWKAGRSKAAAGGNTKTEADITAIV